MPGKVAAVVGIEGHTVVASPIGGQSFMDRPRRSLWSIASIRGAVIGMAVVSGGIVSGGTTTGVTA